MARNWFESCRWLFTWIADLSLLELLCDYIYLENAVVICDQSTLHNQFRILSLISYEGSKFIIRNIWSRKLVEKYTTLLELQQNFIYLNSVSWNQILINIRLNELLAIDSSIIDTTQIKNHITRITLQDLCFIQKNVPLLNFTCLLCPTKLRTR